MSSVIEIKEGIYEWLSKSMGKEHIFKISFDTEFVADNLIDATFDGQSIDQVAFDTDHATTLALLAKAIEKTEAVFKCIVSGPLELTCQGKFKGEEIVIVGPTVQGGISQPVATIEVIQEPLKVTVIENHQTSPRPAKPYAYFMLGMETTYPLEDDYLGFDEDGFSRRAGMRAITVQVQAIGPGALQYVRDARRALNSQSVRDELYYEYGLAFIEPLGIQNLTGFLETETEERAQLDVRFSHSEVYLEEGNWIETAEIKGKAGALEVDDVFSLV